MEKLKMNLSNKVLHLSWAGENWEDVPMFGIYEYGKKMYLIIGYEVWEIFTVDSSLPNMICFGNIDSLQKVELYDKVFHQCRLQLQEVITNKDLKAGLYQMENGGLLLNDGNKTYYIRIMEVEE